MGETRLTLKSLHEELELLDDESVARDERVLEACRAADGRLSDRVAKLRERHLALYAWTRTGFGLLQEVLEALLSLGPRVGNLEAGLQATGQDLAKLEDRTLEMFESAIARFERVEALAQADRAAGLSGDLHLVQQVQGLSEKLGVLGRRPRRCLGVARCSQGRLGLVTSFGTVTTVGGDIYRAFRGRHVPRLDWRWSSRDPVWVWGPKWGPPR